MDDSKELEALRAENAALKQALAELESRSEDRYRKLVEHSGLGIFLADAKGNYLAANPAGCAMVGYTEEELKKLNMVDLVPAPEQVAFVTARMPDLQRAGRKEVIRQLLTKDGRIIHVEVHASVLPDGSIEGVVRDVSERVEQENIRHDLESALQQAQKLESVGRLSGGIAHDFNNILAVILGNASLLERDNVDAHGDIRLELRDIIDACGRASGLVRQLLAFSRKQLLRPQVIDVGDVLSELQPLLARLLGEKIDIKLELAAESTPVLADANQLEQVFMNLAVNARDAMPDGGSITFCTSNEGEAVRIDVEDTGAGIAPEILPFVFEPFFTTKAPGEGTGLGLATSHGIIAQSGGTIRVESEQGKGARFTLLLPRVAEAATDPVEAADRPAPATVRRRLLLVEDNPEFRETCARILTRAGYEVVVARSGGEAQSILERDANFAVVVSDIVMPGMTGIELARWAREANLEVPVLLLSGYAAPMIAAEEVSVDGVSFLGKPFASKELLERVSALSRGYRVF